MHFVARYRVSLAAVLAALGATGAFLAYGLPRTSTPGQRMVDLARVHHYSLALVRRTFAAHGIHLRYASKPGVAPLWLSAAPLPAPYSGLYVLVGDNDTGHVSWGPKPAHQYDQPVGNLLVHYGGTNPNTLAAVKAAVATLR
jgi:hypothetical protein